MAAMAVILKTLLLLLLLNGKSCQRGTSTGVFDITYTCILGPKLKSDKYDIQSGRHGCQLENLVIATPTEQKALLILDLHWCIGYYL